MAKSIKELESWPIDQIVMETSKPSDYKDEGELINTVWDAALINVNEVITDKIKELEKERKNIKNDYMGFGQMSYIAKIQVLKELKEGK